MATLGQKLRELRQQKGYKLNEVAEGAGLSISFISLIERDKASISVENLNKLANFYNVRLFQIFQEIEEEDAFIVRKSQTEDYTTVDFDTKPTLIMLSPEDNLSLKAILANIPPGSQDEEMQLYKGETFIFIKEGSVIITLPNKKPIRLVEGDSAHMTSFKGTVIKNASNEQPVQMLIVSSAITQHLYKDGSPMSYVNLAK